MFELKGYAAIVTGGARGIGRAIALSLADAGADVLITYKGNTAAADAVVAEIAAKGRKAIAMQADAADPDSAVAVVAKAMESFGKVDLLVNNAGITRDTLILRMTPEQWREVIDTNLSGAFYMTKAAVREMLRAKSGRIVNITSVSGQAGNAGQANYSSAKAGMIGLTKATAREVASRGGDFLRAKKLSVLAALEAVDVMPPEPDEFPTGEEFVSQYLEPIAEFLADRIEFICETDVVAVGRGRRALHHRRAGLEMLHNRTQQSRLDVVPLGRGGLGIGQAQDVLRVHPAQQQPRHSRLARSGRTNNCD